ncbi:MAG: hypothetical protein ACNS64_02430, partial [Candidatus Halalkalibacterium sp. M3_1C_030]
RKGEAEAFIIPDNAKDYTYELIDIMLKHGVEVERAGENFTLRDVYSYWDGESSRRSFNSGDFIIKTSQPRHIFIRV